MLGQIAAAQFDLEAVIAELGRSGNSAALLDSRSQLGALNVLRQQIGGASTANLSTMRSEIAAAIATGQSTATAARAAAATTPDAAELIALAREAHEQVDAVMRGMKDFDPYLKFASAEDEAAYRQREDERRAYIAAQQAKGMPEGDLNASGAAVGQMADAAAHGAGDSPEFQKRWDALTASTNALRAQLIRDGKDVSEFDAHLRDDLRHILRSKGLTDAEIEKRLAEHPDNPLDAVKAYVAEQKRGVSEQEIEGLEAKATAYKAIAASESMPQVRASVTPPANLPASALDAMADLKALGVVAAAHDADAPPAHGVVASATNGQSVNVRS